MKKLIVFIFLTVIFLGGSAFGHKFYIAIFQINHNSDKQTVEITTRIFVDDLNEALSKRYSSKTHLGEATESPQDVELMNKYLTDKFRIKINGKIQPYQFVRKELDANTLICYYKIRNVSSVNEIEVRNIILMDWNDQQQNIIQMKVGTEKHSLLLKDGDSTGLAIFGQ